jgi:tetratricopeptide (TPR) repeat protein
VTSERIQRRIEELLDEADQAMARLDWETVHQRALAVLAAAPENQDGLAYRDMALRGLSSALPIPPHTKSVSAVSQVPVSFASGRYEVKRFLGEGGKKKVYLSHDTLLDRDVAFALIKTEGLDAAARERVSREAQAMGRLGSHPHIVTVFDIGEESGQPYLVLPLLPGGDVEGLLDKGDGHRLPIEQAIKLAVDTCHGLEFAHSKGIVHRDLKPGNVWLAEDGRAMIGDFGLAVAMDRSRLTQAGMMVGTVNYMPPEQAMGGEITPRSDLYSLGAMLYEMVCGRPPFVGDESVAIIGQHLNKPPVAPSWHRPDCPPALEALILRLLEKDPSNRPASATDVREALTLAGKRDQKTESEENPDPRPGQGEGGRRQGEGDPLYRRTFVGREQELRQLQQAFDLALSGQGGLVMVVGEPGIGKTALCEQLMTYVAMRGGKALAGHCYEEGSLSLPYLAFVEAMRSYVLAREPDGLRSDMGTGAADIARIVSEVRDRVQVEMRPEGDPEDDRWRLLQAITSFLRNASTVQPLLILLEDLHWADRGTLDLLLHIARNLQGARILIVGNYRDIEVDRAHPLSGALADLRRAGSFHTIRLRGLTIDEVQRMMTNIRGQDVPLSRAELIHRQTEGNPLFVQEVLRYLVEEGITVRRDGRYALANPDQPEAGIPEGLRDVIGKRLNRLSAETNRTLSIAAVIGRDFDLQTLHGMSIAGDDELMNHLEEALRVGILEERGQVGGVHYRFAHAFFRQTLYEELSAARRIRLHQQIGRALETLHSGRISEHASELAEHFSHSSDPEDLSKAVAYGEAAARRALAVFDYGEASRLLERALDVQEVLGPEDRSRGCELRLALGQALMLAGEPLRVAEQVAEAAFREAEQLADRERASEACNLALESLSRYGAATMAGTGVFRRWVERADHIAEPGSLARVYTDYWKATLLIAAGKWGEAYASIKAALSLARRLNDPEALFAVVQQYLNVGWGPEREEERFQLAQEFLTHPTEGVSLRVQLRVLRECMRRFMEWGQRAEAEALGRKLSDSAERTRDVTEILEREIFESVRATQDGQLEDAVALAERLVIRAEELGSPIFGLQFYSIAADVPLVYLGRAEDALAAGGRAEIAAGSESEWVGGSRFRRMALLAHLGRLDEARSLLHSVLDALHIAAGEPVRSNLFVPMLEAAVLTKDREAAGILAARLKPASHLLMTQGMMCVARRLGNASVLFGNPIEARAYYNQALQVCAKVNFRPEIALTRLGLAELLLEYYPDERDAAIGHLDFAIGEFREMKMQPSLERALRHRGLLRA